MQRIAVLIAVAALAGTLVGWLTQLVGRAEASVVLQRVAGFPGGVLPAIVAASSLAIVFVTLWRQTAGLRPTGRVLVPAVAPFAALITADVWGAYSVIPGATLAVVFLVVTGALRQGKAI